MKKSIEKQDRSRLNKSNDRARGAPQTNGICERFRKTILDELYKVAFRMRIDEDLETLQRVLDLWINYSNNERTHPGKMCRSADRHA